MSQFTTTLKLGGKDCIINVPPNSKASRLANAVFCPLGAAPTQAWVVMKHSDLLDITSSGVDLSESHTLVWTQVGDGLIPNKTLNFQGLYIVSAERVLPGGVGDPNALFLVELADARWLINSRSNSGSIRANIRSYANSSDYLTGTSGGTWATLLTSLWDSCALLGAYPGLPGTLPIDGVPQNQFYIGLNSWKSLCAVLEQLDCAVKHDVLAGTYSIVQLGEAQVIAEHADTLIFDGDPLKSTPVAATLRIHFFYHRKSYGQERDTELATNWAYDGLGDVKDVATGIALGSGVKGVWDDLPWILDEDNVVSNNAALETRRDNRKSRYVTRVSVTNAHSIHKSLLSDILPGGQVRAVLWRNWADGETNPLGGTCTEYLSQVSLVTGFNSQNGFGPAWFDSELAAPERENFSPADLGRHTFPNYPRLPNILQVYHSGNTSGESVMPNASGLHPGRIARYVAGTLTKPGPGTQDCWILFVDDWDTVAGQVSAINYDYYGPGRLSGMETVSASAFPIYIVRRGAAVEGGIPFRNDSGETVPAYGCMRIMVTATINGIEYVTTGKHTTDFKRLSLVNRGVDVANGAYGLGNYLWTLNWVLYDDTNTPAFGEGWGPVPYSWKIAKGYYGFTIGGSATGGSTDRVQAQQHVVNDVIGVITATLSQGSTATALVAYLDNAEDFQYTGFDLTVRDWQLNASETVLADTKLEPGWRGNYWIASNPYCAASDNLPADLMLSQSGSYLTTESGNFLTTES